MLHHIPYSTPIFPLPLPNPHRSNLSSLKYPSAPTSLRSRRSLDLILWHRTQIQNSIVRASARKARRRSRPRKSMLKALKSIAAIALKLGVLPEPLNMVMKEHGNGRRGGGGESWRGVLRGGSGGWGRRKRSILGSFVVLVMGYGLVISLGLGKELNVDMLLGVIGLSLFGVSISGWKSRIKDWVLGFVVVLISSLWGQGKRK